MEDENGAEEGGMIFGGRVPPEMKEKLDELMHKMMGKIGGRDKDRCDKGTCDCQQVGKLSGDMLLKLKKTCADSSKRKRKAEVLISEVKLLKQKNEHDWTKFWEAVYETTGISSHGDYHWCADGRIMKRGED